LIAQISKERFEQMSRDTSSQERIALAEEMGRFARSKPIELAELMYTSDLAEEILQTGLDLFIQQEQPSEVQSQMPDELMQLKKEHEHIVQQLHNATLALKVTEDDLHTIIIVLDSKEGHITKVFTSDPGLVVRVVDIDTEAQDPVWGPYDPEVRVVVVDVDAAIKEIVPSYEPE
jgi:hypothetical protein